MPVTLPDDGHTRRARILYWLAHHETHLTVTALAAVLAGLLAHRHAGTTDMPKPVALPVVVALAGSVAAHCAQMWHARRLCGHCAALMPLDGLRQADRRDRTLAAYHLFYESLPGALLMAVVCVAPLVVSPTGLHWADLSLYGWLAVTAYATRVHNPLLPWCPRCHWGEEGDEEPSPVVPDPVQPSVVMS